MNSKNQFTEKCYISTQKHQLYPGKPNFKPGPIWADALTHLHWESYSLRILQSTFFSFIPNGFNREEGWGVRQTLRPYFRGRTTVVERASSASRGLGSERGVTQEAKCPGPSAGARGGLDRGGSKSGEEVREHCCFTG